MTSEFIPYIQWPAYQSCMFTDNINPIISNSKHAGTALTIKWPTARYNLCTFLYQTHSGNSFK
jgi:hypothetical protein